MDASSSRYPRGGSTLSPPPPPAVSPTARGVTVVATSSPSPRGPARQSNQLLTASTPGARPEREWTEQKRLATVAAGALFLGTPRQGGADGALPAAVGSNARSPCPTFPPSPPPPCGCPRPRLLDARASQAGGGQGGEPTTWPAVRTVLPAAELLPRFPPASSPLTPPEKLQPDRLVRR